MKTILLLTSMAVCSAALAQDAYFTGYAVDPCRVQPVYVYGSVDVRTEKKPALEDTTERLRRMNEELEASIRAMRMEYELRQQTAELREQNELLRKLAQKSD